MGQVTVKGGDAYTYELVFTRQGTHISGFSITDLQGPGETKASITGEIDTVKEKLTFTENKILSTKDKSVTFCMLRGQLSYGRSHKITTLKGTFTGYAQDGKTQCGTGKIKLASAQELMTRILAIKEKDTATRTPQPAKTAPTGEVAVDHQSKQVLPGNTLKLYCPQPHIDIEIWDDKIIDGDVVTLTYGNQLLLSSYTITAQHKKLSVELTGDQEVLKVIAVNEGAEPQNTARIRITSGTEVYDVDATTTMGKDVYIVLQKQK